MVVVLINFIINFDNTFSFQYGFVFYRHNLAESSFANFPIIKNLQGSHGDIGPHPKDRAAHRVLHNAKAHNTPDQLLIPSWEMIAREVDK